MEPDHTKVAGVIRERGIRSMYSLPSAGQGVLYVGEEGEQFFPPIPTHVVEVTGQAMLSWLGGLWFSPRAIVSEIL